jgi:3-deoxy-D-manno-octulosonic-acid transferase
MRALVSEIGGSAAGLPPAIRGDPGVGFVPALLHGLYDVGWLLFAVFGAPWLLWMSLRRPGFGTMVLERLGRGVGAIPRATRPRILVHGVSVGEVKAARSLVTLLEERHPGCELVLSSSTPTGIEMARKLYPRNLSVRYPADLSFVARRFLRALEPVLVILVELEVWPNFLRECNRQGRAVAVVNGRITKKSHGRYGLLKHGLPEFHRISLFCAQSEEYARRFGSLGIDPARLCVTGNVKFDGLRSGPVEAGEELTRFVAPGAARGVVVAGSTHEPEELYVARALRRALPAARLVLVPRHPPRCGDVVERLRSEGIATQRLSELRAGAVPDTRAALIVDTIGELERVYALADVVFVGGSLVPHGGQNLLEPAAQGKPVLFGPHVHNFDQEAALLLAAGAARRVRDPAELERELAALLADPAARHDMGAAGMRAVEAQRGAVHITLRALEALGLPVLAARPGPG